MDNQLLDRFVHLLVAQTGIVMREPDRPALAKKIRERMQALALDSLERYYAMLQPALDGTLSLAQTQEWQALAMRITTGESYFFRDRGQFNLLETELLPTAIAAQRQQAERNGTKPKLKIWSAGCSTGEELYSLAILLTQLLPDWERWNLQLVGTDINLEFLQAARRGCYTNWSFRQVSPGVRERYFQPANGRRWEINPNIRKLARFRYGNLLADDFREPAFQDCDLIVCRNVFIYFSAPAIACVLEKFKANLRPDGYLLCGHAELRDCNLKGLSTRVFPASMVYQRQGNDAATSPQIVSQAIPTLAGAPSPSFAPALLTALPITLPKFAKVPPVSAAERPINSRLTPPAIAPSMKPKRAIEAALPEIDLESAVASVESKDSWERVEALLQEGETEAALALAERLPPTLATLLLLASSYADRGDLDRAERSARAANRQDADAIAPLQVLAHIAEERGNLVLAKRYWRQINYLNPDAIVAYLELAAILQREGNPTGAQKQLLAARELLEARQPTESIDCGHGRPERTAAWLLQHLGRQLAIAS